MDDDFGTVAIVGVGLIGGSMGMALKKRSRARQVLGVGRNEERLRIAQNLAAIDTFSTDIPSAIAAADLIVLCTPVEKIVEDLPSILKWAKPGAVVTDAGSVKTVIVNAAGGDSRFVGSHPMAGSERTGVEAARPTLFEEATWALTPTQSTDGNALEKVAALAHCLGAATLVLTPTEHDNAVAVTSHLPHVMAWALMRLAGQRAERDRHVLNMSAGSFADATRVAASSPELWRGICMANKEALLRALADFRGEMDRAAQAISEGDENLLEAYFAKGALAKKNWQRRDR